MIQQLLWLVKKHEVMLINEEIKPVALAIMLAWK